MHDSGSEALKLTGDLTSSLLSTGSFGKITATDVFGTLQTATQNSITTANSLTTTGTVATGVWNSTFGAVPSTLISGSAVVNAANVSGSLTSTGSFGSLVLVTSGALPAIQAIGDISSSLLSTGSFGNVDVTNVNATNIFGTIGTATQNSITSATGLVTLGSALNTLISSSAVVDAANVSGSITSTGSFGSLVVADKVQGTLALTDLDLTGNLEVGGNISTSGSITAREFHTEFVSASVIFASGSTKLGDTQDDIHRFTGSIESTGSLTITSASLKVDSQGNNEIVGGLYLSSASGSFSGSFTGSGFATVDDATALAIALG